MDKILIIEDDPDIAAIERDYLELSGCAVTIAQTAPTVSARHSRARLT